MWLIARLDTHVVDVLFSASATAPTMPTNYTEKRRIGAVRTDSSGNLIPFLQYGDDFYWKSPPFLDVDDATLTTTKKNYTLSGVPGGLVVEVCKYTCPMQRRQCIFQIQTLQTCPSTTPYLLQRWYPLSLAAQLRFARKRTDKRIIPFIHNYKSVCIG
jgi:hypothetical protein